ncbi:MAG: cell division protein FtsL [Clostridia bacterium]|nr:cell division protein FtsL [Clostridia bacterium]
MKSIVTKIAVFAFAVFAVIVLVSTRFQINEKRAEIEMKQEENDKLRDEKEALENELAEIGDEDHIVDIAKEKLNLRLPEEIIFYNDLYN